MGGFSSRPRPVYGVLDRGVFIPRRPFLRGGKRKTRRTIRMKKGEYLREHHHLFRVLQNPTRRALNAELRAQKRELKERGLKG
jgi:hypothetical protein